MNRQSGYIPPGMYQQGPPPPGPYNPYGAPPSQASGKSGRPPFQQSGYDSQKTKHFYQPTPPLPGPYPGYPPDPNFNFGPPSYEPSTPESSYMNSGGAWPDYEYDVPADPVDTQRKSMKVYNPQVDPRNNPRISQRFGQAEGANYPPDEELYPHEDHDPYYPRDGEDDHSYYSDESSDYHHRSKRKKKRKESWSDESDGDGNPYMTLAICTCYIFFFIPLGYMAVRKARKARLYYLRGDIRQATKYGKQSKCFSLCTIFIGNFLVIGGVLIYVFLFANADE